MKKYFTDSLGYELDDSYNNVKRCDSVEEKEFTTQTGCETKEPLSRMKPKSTNLTAYLRNYNKSNYDRQ